MNKKTLFIIGSLIALDAMQRKNNKPPIFYADNLINNYNGFIIPGIGIFIKKEQKENKDFYLHEYEHWKQYQKEGFWGLIIGYLQEAYKKGYDLNKYEIEARIASGESKECQTNYTECVRTGKALCYNKNFRK